MSSTSHTEGCPNLSQLTSALIDLPEKVSVDTKAQMILQGMIHRADERNEPLL